MALIPVRRAAPDLTIPRSVNPSPALLANLVRRYAVHIGGVPNIYEDATGRRFFAVADADQQAGAA